MQSFSKSNNISSSIAALYKIITVSCFIEDVGCVATSFDSLYIYNIYLYIFNWSVFTIFALFLCCRLVFFYFISFAIRNSFDFLSSIMKYNVESCSGVISRIKTSTFNGSHENIAIETYSYATRKGLDFKKELVAYLIPFLSFHFFFVFSSSCARLLSLSIQYHWWKALQCYTLCLWFLEPVSFRFVCERAQDDRMTKEWEEEEEKKKSDKDGKTMRN